MVRRLRIGSHLNMVAGSPSPRSIPKRTLMRLRTPWRWSSSRTRSGDHLHNGRGARGHRQPLDPPARCWSGETLRYPTVSSSAVRSGSLPTLAGDSNLGPERREVGAHRSAESRGNRPAVQTAAIARTSDADQPRSSVKRKGTPRRWPSTYTTCQQCPARNSSTAPRSAKRLTTNRAPMARCVRACTSRSANSSA